MISPTSTYYSHTLTDLKTKPMEKIMPCGSRHSCLDCTSFIMATKQCSHIEKMTESEYDQHLEFIKKPEPPKKITYGLKDSYRSVGS